MSSWETFFGGAILFAIYLAVSSLLALRRPNFTERPKRGFVILDRD